MLSIVENLYSNSILVMSLRGKTNYLRNKTLLLRDRKRRTARAPRLVMSEKFGKKKKNLKKKLKKNEKKMKKLKKKIEKKPLNYR